MKKHVPAWMRPLFPLAALLGAGLVWAPQVRAQDVRPNDAKAHDVRPKDTTAKDAREKDARAKEDELAVIWKDFESNTAVVAEPEPASVPSDPIVASLPQPESEASDGDRRPREVTHEYQELLAGELPVPVQFVNGAPAITLREEDLPVLDFEVGTVTPMVLDEKIIQGQFVQSRDDLREARRLHVQHPFLTLIEFQNGERPTGKILCGDCPDRSNPGARSSLSIDHVGSTVAVRPRVFSHPDHGVISTNFVIETVDMKGTNHNYMFTAMEISGLIDETGQPLRRTDVHEVRSARWSGSVVVGDTFESRVALEAERMQEEFGVALRTAEQTIVGEKAHQSLEVFGDFESDRRWSRRLSVESAMTVGDETIIQLRLIGAQSLGLDPLCFLETPKGRRRLLPIHRIQVGSGEYKGKKAITITLSMTGVKLGAHDRLVVQVVDELNEEFEASAGRA